MNGNATTPIGSFYDSELVFAGEGNLETTSLVDMSTSLGLFFQNQTTGALSSFPSYYSFGGDTGEAVSNLAVSYSNGIAYVQVGNPNYVYLGNASLTLRSDFKLPGSVFSTPATTQSMSSSRGSIVSGISNDLLLFGGAIAVVSVVAVVALPTIRRRKPPGSNNADLPADKPRTSVTASLP